VDDLKNLRDQAQAIRQYMRQRDYSLQAQNDAAEIKVRAERRLGEILKRNPPRRGNPQLSSRSTIGRIPDGVSRDQSSQWQRIAGITEPVFERKVAEAKQTGELTTAGMLRTANSLEKQIKTQAIQDAPQATQAIKTLQQLIDQGKRFGTIYADPPWKYGNQGTRAATDNHYPTMTVNEIAALPVPELAADDCHLHLWSTTSFLPDALGLIERWGFAYKGMLVWCKPTYGLGNYWRSAHELLLLGVRGNAPFRARDKRSWVEAARGRHSAKPGVFRRHVEDVSPGPRLELFGRVLVEGWTVWGNEVKTDLLTPVAV
jgi:N6-adenosine-specific RNA methylase IME4